MHYQTALRTSNYTRPVGRLRETLWRPDPDIWKQGLSVFCSVGANNAAIGCDGSQPFSGYPRILPCSPLDVGRRMSTSVCSGASNELAHERRVVVLSDRHGRIGGRSADHAVSDPVRDAVPRREGFRDDRIDVRKPRGPCPGSRPRRGSVSSLPRWNATQFDPGSRLWGNGYVPGSRFDLGARSTRALGRNAGAVQHGDRRDTHPVPVDPDVLAGLRGHWSRCRRERGDHESAEPARGLQQHHPDLQPGRAHRVQLGPAAQRGRPSVPATRRIRVDGHEYGPVGSRPSHG
jgi:hypothetical protein